MSRALAAILLCALLAIANIAVAAAPPPPIAEAADSLVAAAGDRRLVLLGEKHGTREIPQLVAELAQRWSADAPLLLALEMPHSEQPALRDFLRATDAATARARLLARPYWQLHDDRHDGRRSHDVLDLLEQVRTLRTQGRDIALLAYDVDTTTLRGPGERDARMAARLRAAYAALPRGRLLVLTGNVHAMTARPDDAPPQLPVPMGSFLRDLDPLAVDVVARDGAFWGCLQRECAPRSETAWRQAETGALVDDVHDLRIVLPRFTVARLVGGAGAD